MPDTTDMDLLRDYAENQSESAFNELIQRHIHLVYSVAWRFVRNDEDARDVTQAVFIILARKASGLRPKTLLAGWLYETTRFTARNFLTSKSRRQQREQEAYMQSTLNDSAADWQLLEPHLEDAMSKLAGRDRALLVLRFYENKTGAEAAALLGIREDAAHKRMARAIEKLRKLFAQRGVTISSAAIAGAVSANSVQAAPVALVKTISAVAAAKGAEASTSTLTLVKGALKIMAWTKAKTAIVISVVLLTAGTTTLAIKKIEAYHAYRDSWRVAGINSDIVDQAAPQVRILPTIFPGRDGSLAEGNATTKWGGINVAVSTIAWVAYEWSPARIVFTTPPPPDKYDFIASQTAGAYKALQRELQNSLGFAGRRETRKVDVLLLKVKNPNAFGLKPPIAGSQNDYGDRGRYVADDRALSTDGPPRLGLSRFLEQAFRIPVIDQTGLTQHFSIDLRWKPQPTRAAALKAIKQAMLDQLGLELVPSREPVEMLVVEKVK